MRCAGYRFPFQVDRSIVHDRFSGEWMKSHELRILYLGRRYLVAEEIRPLLSALEALKADPENRSRLEQLVRAFDDLGPQQGAVLTYAPYVGVLLSDVPFDN